MNAQRTGRFGVPVAGATLALALALQAPVAVAELEEIVVSAQRRAQSQQDVPIAIRAFDSEEMEARQFDEPLDIVNFVPNLFGGNNTGLGTANSYYLRGLGNTESIATFDPPVGTYVDEVYISRQNGNNVAFFDVEAIEVLRGPQGTLFGRNTTGGAVSIRMAKPAEEIGGFIEGGLGDYDRQMLRGSIDLPIADNVLTKISAFWLDDAGYVKNVNTGDRLNGQEARGIRGDIRMLFDDQITWDISAEIIEDENLNITTSFPGLSAFQRPQDNGRNDNTDRRESNTGIRASSNSRGSLEQLDTGSGLGNNVNSYAVSSHLTLDLDFGTVEFITAYRNLEQDFIIDFFDGPGAQGGFTIANQGEHEQVSQEIKFTNSYLDDKLDLVAGFFYFTEDNQTDFSDVFALPFGNLLLADRLLENELTSIALYAQADYAFSEKWSATLGLRWTDEEKTLDVQDFKPGIVANNPFMNFLAFPAAPGTELTNANLDAAGIDRELSEQLLTPRFAIQYFASDNFMAFASATRGFKSGGWNARGTAAEELLPFDPEKVWSYEAGFRSEFANRTVRLNVTAFYTDVQDFQVPSAFVRDNGTVAFITRNFADLENQGLEIDATWAPIEGLSLYAAVGIQDAEQKPGAEILAQQAACRGGDAGSAGVGIVDLNCNIAETTRAPDLTYTLGGSYRFEIPAISGYVQGNVNYRYTDELNVGTSGLPNGAVDDTGELSMGVTLGVGPRLRIIAECTNCNNELTQNAVLAGTFYYNEPRRVNVRVKYDF
ncbi:MAG: TonB-dependent receptor [Pseudomonadota bacterium]